MPPTSIPESLRSMFARSPIALSLSPATPDHVLMLVNRSFEDLSGYSNADIVGRNCRFMQGGLAQEEALRPVRHFVADASVPSVRAPLINFRADGRPFVNLLYMSRLRSSSGEDCFFFASQFDISRSNQDTLAQYDGALASTVSHLHSPAAASGFTIDGSVQTLGNSLALIAQAKLTLDSLDIAHGL